MTLGSILPQQIHNILHESDKVIIDINIIALNGTVQHTTFPSFEQCPSHGFDHQLHVGLSATNKED
jgi:hypothetical protein